jgi:hypothetical protein
MSQENVEVILAGYAAKGSDDGSGSSPRRQ